MSNAVRSFARGLPRFSRLSQNGVYNLQGASCHGLRRGFASQHEDLSLEGRYSTALMQVVKAQNNMDKVFQDLDHIRACSEESVEFRTFIETPAMKNSEKIAAFQALGQQYGYDKITLNYINTLIENRRLRDLVKLIDNFEVFYRAEKGQVVCHVVSPAELSNPDKKKVVQSLSKRAGGAELIVHYEVSPSIVGGLVVKMGDAVFDFSIASRLERLQNKLLAPV